jgi:hypothetical protein
MTAVVLHLSDIHIKSKSDPVLARAKKIAACVYARLPEAKAVFIVVSGDIAYGGQTDQYKLALSFLRSIAECIRAEKSVPIHFVLCPGNHDCNFDLSNRTRSLVLESLASKGAGELDESVIDACCVVQVPFFEFAAELNTEYRTGKGDRLWQTLRYEVSEKQIVFDCVNLSWVSSKHEDPGSLVFPHERYSRSESDKPSLSIAVLHHPLHWLTQHSYQSFRKALRTRAHVIFTGHEHIGNVGENTDIESGHSAFVEGCVLQDELSPQNSAFMIVEFDLDNETYRSVRFEWTNDLYEIDEEGSWEDYRNIPIKASNPFDIQKSFAEVLSDPGANFKRLSAHALTLSDIFVFPDLVLVTHVEETRRIVSSQLLTDLKRLEGAVILEGEERIGETSLLFQLFESYHERGFVPILVRGGDLHGANPKDIDSWIGNAVREQYGKNALSRFSQLEKGKKIVLFDDFEECRMAAASFKARVIAAIRNRFDYAVITVGELFDLGKVLTEMDEELRKSLRHYRMLPFGYALRSKLTRKWFQLSAKDGSFDEETLFARCHQAERLMDVAMVRNIVPSLPLYLLTLLQSIDAGISGEFHESALGTYYQFLVTEGMRAAGISPTRWDELIEYCSDLAWHFHCSGAHELPKTALAEFNTQFSTERHTVEFGERLMELIAARILVASGELFRFRYHYTYYLLKGRYLNRNLSEPAIISYIERCCGHLYTRDNANTILFMAHQQAGQPLIMDKIVATLKKLFIKEAPVTFAEGDTKGLEQLVRDLPKLEYSGEAPERHREKVGRLKDELDDGKDGLADAEEGGDELSFHAQLVMVFKTVEILGQLVQNQYAALPRSRRVSILEELFDGPMRGLRGYFALIAAEPESLISEIDALTLPPKNVSLAELLNFEQGERECQRARGRSTRWNSRSRRCGWCAQARA